MKDKSSRSRFTRYIIARKFQLKYAFIGFIILFCYSIFLFSIAIYPQFMDIYHLYNKKEPLTAEELDQLYNFKSHLVNMAIIFLIGFCLCFALIIILTYRFLRPLYRINENIYKLMDKNLTVRIDLKEDDELKEIADDINKFIEDMEKLIMSLRYEQEEISMILFQAKDQVHLQSTKDILNKIAKHNEKIIEKLMSYKVLGDK